VQGPFTAKEMHLWLESNYLQPELPICGMVSTCTHVYHFVLSCVVSPNLLSSKLVLLHVYVLLSNTVMVRLQLRWDACSL